MNPRSEPLLWVQLISLGALPLELLLLLLVLAGSDPGPLPQLERLLCWALGALAPALLLWRQPADPRSLLLVRAAGPSDPALTLKLAQGQRQAVPRLLFAAGVAGLLPLLSWLDAHAALASNFSPLHGGSRLGALLLSVAVLALVVWQWHQLVQASWILISPENSSKGSGASATDQQVGSFTSLGLPLLELPTLTFEQKTHKAAPQPVAQTDDRANSDEVLATPQPQEQPDQRAQMPTPAEPEEQPEDEQQRESERQPEPQVEPEEASNAEPALAEGDSSANTIAVEPEQAPEEPQGADLDEQITADDLTTGG